MSGIKNISLKTFKQFLSEQGLKPIRTKGGHETWSKKDLLRPVTFQSHIDPVPQHIVQNTLKNIRLTKKDFENWLMS